MIEGERIMMYWNKLLNPVHFREEPSVPKTSSDQRSPFKKDFDTVCNSTILRRLQDKAQVFPLEQEDYARTRLTHSIEVMSVASSLALQAVRIIQKPENRKYICEKQEQRSSAKQYINDIPTILNTAALLHDMGNPPFGHLGEQIIRDWFSQNLERLSITTEGIVVLKDVSNSPKDTLAFKLKGKYANDLLNFEGNAQLLRLVTKLCYVTDETGMNLSFPVIASFLKYPCSSSEINKKKLSHKKMGYFEAEREKVKQLCLTLGMDKCRHPLAFLLEAADDIAYLTADIEDAHKKGILSITDIVDYLNPKKEDSVIEAVLSEISRYRNDAKRINYPNIDDYIMHRLRVYIKGVMIDAINNAFDSAYGQIMEGKYEKELLQESKVSMLTNVLRKIESDKIYYCSSIVESKTRAYAIVSRLLEKYVLAVLNYDSQKDEGSDSATNLLYLSLSANYRFVCEAANKSAKSESERLYNKLLLVTDQISGMTDTRALSVYHTVTAM